MKKEGMLHNSRKNEATSNRTVYGKNKTFLKKSVAEVRAEGRNTMRV